MLEREKASLRDAIATTLERAGPEAVRAHLAERISLLESELIPEMQARRFVHIVSLLAWHEREDFLSNAQVNGLFDTANAILRIHGIPEESSKMSGLHGELRLLRSQLRRKEGRLLEAAWDAVVARSVSGRGELEEGRAALAIALRAKRRGETRLALAAFADAEAHAVDRPTLERARLGRIQLLRLAGHLGEAEELSSELARDRDLSAAARLELDWEAMCRKVRKTSNLLPLVLATGRGGSHRHSSYVIESTVWVKTSSHRRYLERVPKVESIRRAFPDNVRRGAPNGRFFDVALRLDRCYDLEIPLVLRLDELGVAFAEATRLPTIDKELLVWAAAARWLARSKQPAPLELVLAEYRALSARVTMGASEDALGMLGDLLTPRQEGADGADIITSGASRAASLANLTLAIAGIKLSGRIKRIFDTAGDLEGALQFEHAEIARHVVSTLSKMRGPFVKVIQFALPLFAAPAEILYAVTAAYDALPPLPSIDARARFEKSIGKRITEVFAAFEDEPIAAASIGQVHRAILLDGRAVAVKVLYPGIERAIAADIRLVKRAKFLLSWIFPRVDFDAVIAAVEEGVRFECDFLRERDFFQKLHALYRNDREIVVPAPVTELCRRDILVTEFVKGQSLHEFAASAGAEERSQVARTVMRFHTGFNHHGILVSDGHPGNVIILDDGRVGFVDFGFCEHYPFERSRIWVSTLRAAAEGRVADVYQALVDLGYIPEGTDASQFDLRAVTRHAQTLFGPGVTSTITRRDVETMMRLMTVDSAYRKLIAFDIRDVRLVRHFLSAMGLMVELEATNPWGDLFVEYCDRPAAENAGTDRPAS
jgi:predicted unusual protein kinase regulating ubiquinone biosynthesis (AarF/ABC1/UbiB family)